MHDRIDLRAPVIILLELAVVREQPAHLAGAAAERQRVVRRHHEIDLAALQHVAELDAGRRLRQADVGRQLLAEPVGAALHPFDVARLDAVFVLEQPAHVDRRGHRIFRHAAALALQVLRAVDALVGVDEEIAVPEHARRKRRDRDERRVAAAHERGVVRQRHLGRVEFLVLQHPPEDLGRLQRDVVEVDALRLDACRRAAPACGRKVRRPASIADWSFARPRQHNRVQTVMTARGNVNVRSVHRRSSHRRRACSARSSPRKRGPSLWMLDPACAGMSERVDPADMSEFLAALWRCPTICRRAVDQEHD